MPDLTDLTVLEELDHDECLKLLATMSIGRVAIVVDDRGPLVVPVNYTLVGEVVVFRSGAGSKLRALRDTPLSFQVDLIDPSHRTGWSVLIRGIAHEATDPRDEPSEADPWAPGDKQHWIRVVPTSVTGRRIRLPDVWLDPRGYL